LLANGEAAPSFDDVTMPIKFIAAESIDVDSTVVSFFGSPERGSSLSGAAAGSNGKGVQQQSLKPKKNGKKYLALAAEISCSGPAKVKIKKQVPANFKFTIDPKTATVTHTQPVKLIVTLIDANGNSITNSDIPFDFRAGTSVGQEGKEYLQLKNGTTEGIALTSVPYTNASDGSVSYVADLNPYLGIFPLRITLTATAVINGNPVQKSAVVTLMGDNTIGQYFALDDLGWAGEKYDHSDVYKIGDIGCFLGNVAMTLTAFGVNVNPKILNDAMNKDDGAWIGNSVAQAVLGNYPGSTVRLNEVKEGDGIEDVTNLPDPADYSRMDNALASRFPVFAEVLNPDHNTVHWILVTGRTSTGDYTILDDGKHGRVTLFSSYGTIYKYYVTEHKP
jgi:hypothetical protein